MTLKITRFLTDAFNKQAKISHFSHKIQVGEPGKVSPTYRSKIKRQFGELFLEDANYIIMTELDPSKPGFDSAVRKFADVVATVLDTEVAKSEVKTLAVREAAAPDADELDDDYAEDAGALSSSVVLLIKVTTK